MLAWELVYPLGALALGVVLAVMLWRNHKRNKRVDPVTEAATREQYDHPDRYDRKTHDQFEAEADRRK
ncbi:hypothetical protein [Brevundimonas sp.]|uniref:hypothetical protein n=1 Tax=Brevundimonas sp. TaxID=1871086 RepID=UPI001D9282FB|nr:hypothetical protein [Brevundimonas sp.]MBA4000644.1 hypothetical protein [Brevundimonas sp.]